MFLVNPFSFNAGTSLINELSNLGLLTNLKVCLDAGDPNSYGGSGQVWKDLSGNGSDFNLGSGSGSDGADPTYTPSGNGGTYREYFAYDGGDRFTLAQSAPSWQSGLHKAGGKFTILQWAYVGNLTGLAPSQAGFGCADNTSASDGKDAINFSNSSSTQNALSLTVTNSTGGASGTVAGAKSTLTVTNNAWQMIAGGLDVDAKTIVFAINGSTETPANQGTATVGTTDSHVPLVIGAAAADGLASAINGCRIAAFALWTTKLTDTQLQSIFSATRGRFGV